VLRTAAVSPLNAPAAPRDEKGLAKGAAAGTDTGAVATAATAAATAAADVAAVASVAANAAAADDDGAAAAADTTAPPPPVVSRTGVGDAKTGTGNFVVVVRGAPATNGECATGTGSPPIAAPPLSRCVLPPPPPPPPSLSLALTPSLVVAVLVHAAGLHNPSRAGPCATGSGGTAGASTVARKCPLPGARRLPAALPSGGACSGGAAETTSCVAFPSRPPTMVRDVGLPKGVPPPPAS